MREKASVSSFNGAGGSEGHSDAISEGFRWRNLPKNIFRLERAAESNREHCWSYVSIYENTPKKLLPLPPKNYCNFI